MPDVPDQNTHDDAGAAPAAQEGARLDITGRATLDHAVELAMNYRGDVTLQLRSGGAVSGYVYDRTHSPPAREAVVRLIPPEGPRRSVPVAEIAAIEFTGRDTASGRSFDTWIKKYVEQKLVGERAEMVE